MRRRAVVIGAVAGIAAVASGVALVYLARRRRRAQKRRAESPPPFVRAPKVARATIPHVWGHHDVSVARVLTRVVYAIPNDRTIYPAWRRTLEDLMARLQRFHHDQFDGTSRLEYEIVGPFNLVGDTAYYRDKSGTASYFDKMTGEVRERDSAHALPPPVFRSHGDAPYDHTMLTYMILADWGLHEMATDGHRYFICKNNTTNAVDTSSIGMCGGSCAIYRESERVGYGLVTEEGWKALDVPGSAVVCYHEGLGHALGMPHPKEDHQYGVMSVGMYSGRCIGSDEIVIEPEILDAMFVPKPPQHDINPAAMALWRYRSGDGSFVRQGDRRTWSQVYESEPVATLQETQAESGVVVLSGVDDDEDAAGDAPVFVRLTWKEALTATSLSGPWIVLEKGAWVSPVGQPRWVYDAGYFEPDEHAQTSWREYKWHCGEAFEFRQVGEREVDVVFLHDASRNIWVKLSGDAAYWKHGAASERDADEWGKLCEGFWA